MCVMDIMNVLRTGMGMSISHIHIWLRNISMLTHHYECRDLDNTTEGIPWRQVISDGVIFFKHQI